MNVPEFLLGSLTTLAGIAVLFILAAIVITARGNKK